MGQITEAERTARIAQLLADLNKVPPEKHEVVRLPWTAGEPIMRQVITIGVDEVLLNPRSHRIRSQLEDDPEWERLGTDPYGEAAQRLIERHVREARTREEFAALKDSLVSEGQTDPGVMTHTGLLVNANTRVVALRDVEDPARRYIRVAVLPQTAKPSELGLLELRLQMQKELKVDYSMTNELLFIEELSVDRHLSNGQIARELRISPESPKKGENEVALRLKLLDLIRTMQRIPDQRLPLTFFNSISYEQLRELHRSYTSLLERDAERAQRHLESFLLSVAVGVTPVHQLRRVDADFMTDYMLPNLEEDEEIGNLAGALAAPSGAHGAPPPGVRALAGEPDPPGDDEPAPVDVRGMINIVTRRDKRVKVPGTNVVIGRDAVKDAVKEALVTGINAKRSDERAEDKLAAPIEAVRQATRQTARAAEAVVAVRDDPEFDLRRRKSLEAAFKKLRRGLRDLEATLADAKIIER